MSQHTTPSAPSPSEPVWSGTGRTAPARGPRSGTLVLGLVLALCGGAATAVGLGAEVDLQLGLIVALLLAAVLLLAVPLLQRLRGAAPEERSSQSAGPRPHDQRG